METTENDKIFWQEFRNDKKSYDSDPKSFEESEKVANNTEYYSKKENVAQSNQSNIAFHQDSENYNSTFVKTPQSILKKLPFLLTVLINGLICSLLFLIACLSLLCKGNFLL